MPLHKNVSVDVTKRDIFTASRKETKYRWIDDHGLLLFARDDIVKQYWPGICRPTIRKIVEKFCSVVYNGPKGAGAPLTFLDLKGLESLRKGYATDKENDLNLRYLMYTFKKYIQNFTLGDTMNLDLEWLQSTEYDPLTKQLIHPKIPREAQETSSYKQLPKKQSKWAQRSPLSTSLTRTSNAMDVYRDRSEALVLVSKSLNPTLIKLFPCVAVCLIGRLMNGDFANIDEFGVECSKISDTHKDKLMSFGVQQIISETEQSRIETESKSDKLIIIVKTTGKHERTERHRSEEETRQIRERDLETKMARNISDCDTWHAFNALFGKDSMQSPCESCNERIVTPFLFFVSWVSNLRLGIMCFECAQAIPDTVAKLRHQMSPPKARTWLMRYGFQSMGYCVVCLDHTRRFHIYENRGSYQHAHNAATARGGSRHAQNMYIAHSTCNGNQGTASIISYRLATCKHRNDECVCGTMSPPVMSEEHASSLLLRARRFPVVEFDDIF